MHVRDLRVVRRLSMRLSIARVQHGPGVGRKQSRKKKDDLLNRCKNLATVLARFCERHRQSRDSHVATSGLAWSAANGVRYDAILEGFTTVSPIGVANTVCRPGYAIHIVNFENTDCIILKNNLKLKF